MPQVRPGLYEWECVRALSQCDLWPSLTPSLVAWQRPSSPVNEVEDPGGIAGGWRRGLKGCWGGLAQEVGCCGGVVVCHWCHCVLLVLTRLCTIIGIVCGLPVSFRWSVEISKYIKCTLSALAATPLQQTWLNESGWLSFTSWMSFMWFTRLFVLLNPSR